MQERRWVLYLDETAPVDQTALIDQTVRDVDATVDTDDKKVASWGGGEPEVEPDDDAASIQSEHVDQTCGWAGLYALFTSKDQNLAFGLPEFTA
jgi:hypothetical protein